MGSSSEVQKKVASEVTSTIKQYSDTVEATPKESVIMGAIKGALNRCGQFIASVITIFIAWESIRSGLLNRNTFKEIDYKTTAKLYGAWVGGFTIYGALEGMIDPICHNIQVDRDQRFAKRLEQERTTKAADLPICRG